jgi:acetylornithine deacetylase/succinyl-diaminopimelate desuccinylase-like protein
MPNQNGDDLIRKVRKHLDEHGYKDVKIRVVGDCDWCRANLNHDLAEAVFKMCEKFGVEYAAPMPPIAVGGWPPTGPYWPAYLFGKDPLKLPIAGGTLGHGNRAHAVNEYFVIEGAGKVYGLAGAEKGVATILYNYAKKT